MYILIKTEQTKSELKFSLGYKREGKTNERARGIENTVERQTDRVRE